MISPLATLCPSFTQTLLDFPVHKGFFLIGCSATNYSGKLFASAWASDHIYNPEKGRYENYQAPPGTPCIEGQRPLSDRPPYLVHLNDDMSIARVQPIEIVHSNNRDMEAIRTNHGGFDGLKPWEWRGQLWCDFYAGGTGRVNFFMGRIEDAKLVDCRRLAPREPPKRDEKNWMPEVNDTLLRWHYDVDTLAFGESYPVTLHSMGSPHLKNLHGGTQVVDGLAIVHDFRYEGTGRVYRHYFVRFDERGAPVALSRPFVLFDVEKVEVVCGLAKHPDGKRLVISHGPALAMVDIAEVMSMPWDGTPQEAAPKRRDPYTPPRIRTHPAVARRMMGVKA